jgi:choline transporter-like protein 2/4/5
MGVSQEEIAKNVEDVKDGGIISNRSCTDICMIPVAAIFVIGWIVILSVAASQGEPERLLKPSNFDNELCGEKELATFKNLWVPRTSRPSYGLCVPRCPKVGDYVCNNRVEPSLDNASISIPNTYYSHTVAEYTAGQQALSRCTLTFSTCSAQDKALADRFVGLMVKVREYACFVNWYSSGATLFRCMPLQDENDNATVAESLGDSTESLNQLSDNVGASAFFRRGFGEVDQSWLVILLSCLTCCAISLVWLFLLRWIMKPLVYLCVILIFALLIIVGYLAMLMADDLEGVKLPGDTATNNQVKLWRALQYAAWILAAMYLVLMAYLFKRIKIAIAIMREASYTFTESPGLIVVPPIVFILFLGWVAFFIITTIYIQSIGELKDGSFEAAARDTFGDSAVNFTLGAANATQTKFSELRNASSSNTTNITTKEWTQDERIKILHAYNFFGFLWASNFCIMFGFYVTAMTGVVYYFSATQTQMQMARDGKSEEEGARQKQTPYFTIPKAVWAGLRYNLGTILFGSLLIAIIQFVRALFLYFKEQFLEEWSESATVKCAIKCIEYCLWYIQKVVEIISKNAFIVCCSMKTNFCSSAGTAMSLIGANGARVGVLATLATVACFLLKVFIVGTNMIIAWALINTEALTKDEPVESGLFPLVGILILSFIIASIFVNVYEALVDTTLMTFLVDEEFYGGEFMVEELAELTDMFKGAELARRDYEKKLREASRKKPESGKEKAPKADPSKEPA